MSKTHDLFWDPNSAICFSCHAEYTVHIAYEDSYGIDNTYSETAESIVPIFITLYVFGGYSGCTCPPKYYQVK